MNPSPDSTRSLARPLTLLIFVGFVPLLSIVPTLVRGNPTVMSAAGAAGYNTVVAWRVALIWTLAGIAACLAAGRAGRLPITADAGDAGVERPLTSSRRWLECAIIAGLVLIAFWPPFLARYGPYIEDAIFATALHRMHGGMVPYLDFEFLYGPLMLVPASWWMRLTGYSLRHYYIYLALLETFQYVLLAVYLQWLMPRFRDRLVVFVVIAVLLANPLLGINYNGVRRLLPLGALLLLARDPSSIRRAAPAGMLLGLSVAWSHDFGLVTVAAAAGLYGLLWLRTPRASLAVTAAVLGVAAVGTWLLVSYLLLGHGFAAYLADTRSLVARFSAGEAGFRFYWTANALAAFGLLAGGIVVLGRGLARWRDSEPAWGDCFFIAAMFTTLLSLKSGLNRSDVWHLDGAFFPLIVACLLPLPRRTMRWSRASARVGAALIGVLAGTNLLGNAPIAAYMAQGWYRGLRDVADARPTLPGACARETEAPCIENERSRPRADVVALGAYLAEPAQRGRRVLLYGELWAFGERLGVYKRDHLNDDFIYDDARGIAAGEWLAQRPDGMVIMARPWYERLVAPPGDSVGRTTPFQPSLAKSAGEWLSSVHYRGVVVERPLVELRWRRTVGARVRADYRLERTFGDLVVLTRRSDR